MIVHAFPVIVGINFIDAGQRGEPGTFFVGMFDLTLSGMRLRVDAGQDLRSNPYLMRNVANEPNRVLVASASSVWLAQDRTLCMLSRYASMPAQDAAKCAAAAGSDGGSENMAAVIASFCVRKRFIKSRHVSASLGE